MQAYPLAWPVGWRRATTRKRAMFAKGITQYIDGGGSYQRYDRIGVGEGVKRILAELRRMGLGDWQVVISSDVPLNREGLPRADARVPKDPGVAVYWQKGKGHRCMAIDRYDRVADNMAAIAATLEAMRSIERHGGADILDRAFTGFVALPNPEQPWQVLGLENSHPSREDVEAAHRKLAMTHHPDRGGDGQTMARINAARDALLEDLREQPHG